MILDLLCSETIYFSRRCIPQLNSALSPLTEIGLTKKTVLPVVQYGTNPDTYNGTGLWIYNNQGYLQFAIEWILIQFRVSSDSKIYTRCKYGNNAWSGWSTLLQ